jgi:hypothetical protein
MSEFTDAFSELLEVQEESDQAYTATIAGTSCPVVLDEAQFDEIIAAGGEGEAGGFKLMVKASALPSRPAHLSAVVVSGRTLNLLLLESANGIYTITAGDPVATES